MSLTKNKFRRKKKHPICRLLLYVFALLLVYSGFRVYANKRIHVDYEALRSQDQRMLEELNTIASVEESLWEGYELFPCAIVDADEKELLSQKLSFRHLEAYTIGAEGLVGKWYAKRLFMPEDTALPKVYRMSLYAPGFGKTWNPFLRYSKTGGSLQVGDAEDVFFLKYDFSILREDEIALQDDLIVKLTEELFPYRMFAEREKAMKELAQLSAGIDAGDPTGDLTAKQQQAFEQLQSLLYIDATEDEWKIAIRNYTDASGKLKTADEAAFLQRSSEETMLGITDYVKYLAYARVHDEELTELLPISSEEHQLSLADKGAVLCAVIAKRGPQNWQELLNKDPYLTLYDLMKQIGAEG